MQGGKPKRKAGGKRRGAEQAENESTCEFAIEEGALVTHRVHPWGSPQGDTRTSRHVAHSIFDSVPCGRFPGAITCALAHRCMLDCPPEPCTSARIAPPAEEAAEGPWLCQACGDGIFGEGADLRSGCAGERDAARAFNQHMSGAPLLRGWKRCCALAPTRDLPPKRARAGGYRTRKRFVQYVIQAEEIRYAINLLTWRRGQIAFRSSCPATWGVAVSCLKQTQVCEE